MRRDILEKKNNYLNSCTFFVQDSSVVHKNKTPDHNIKKMSQDKENSLKYKTDSRLQNTMTRPSD